MRSKDKTRDIEKENIVIETKQGTNYGMYQGSNQGSNQGINQQINQETKMSSAAKAVCKSHPNLKSAPSECSNNVKEEPGKMTKQGSSYGEGNRCAPNNNIFFEERSNHLSSKGD